jgi:prevent-host-death family protein
MRQVNVHEAKTRLSELISAAEAGEEVIIARANKPVVRLVPVTQMGKQPRVPDLHRGQIWMSDDFDEYLPEDFLVRTQDKQ